MGKSIPVNNLQKKVHALLNLLGVAGHVELAVVLGGLSASTLFKWLHTHQGGLSAKGMAALSGFVGLPSQKIQAMSIKAFERELKNNKTALVEKARDILSKKPAAPLNADADSLSAAASSDSGLMVAGALKSTLQRIFNRTRNGYYLYSAHPKADRVEKSLFLVDGVQRGFTALEVRMLNRHNAFVWAGEMRSLGGQLHVMLVNRFPDGDSGELFSCLRFPDNVLTMGGGDLTGAGFPGAHGMEEIAPVRAVLVQLDERPDAKREALLLKTTGTLSMEEIKEKWIREALEKPFEDPRGGFTHFKQKTLNSSASQTPSPG